jgi:hypothetical protein
MSLLSNDHGGTQPVISDIPPPSTRDSPDAALPQVRSASIASGVEPESGETPVVPLSATGTASGRPKTLGKRPAELAVVTATSPYTRRDTDGIPLLLPPIDEGLDFDAFVSEKLAALTALEKEGKYTELRSLLNDLLAIDPINRDATQARSRILLRDAAEQAYSQAEKAAEKGHLLKALKLYATVPDSAPESSKAKEKIAQLKPLAIERELTLGEKELKIKANWLRAQRRFKEVLELEPGSAEALKGVRSAERKMRAKNIPFTAYVRLTAKNGGVQETAQDIDEAIAKRFGADEDLARVARLYAQGQLPKALKKAEALEKKSEGQKRESMRQMREALKKIQTSYERIRNEISNDPNQALSQLIDLEREEQNIVPKDVKSYLRRELEGQLAEAFATKGTSLFDREGYAEAFDLWLSGFKLDPSNSTVLAGLKKLEDKAKQLADEADLAAQRGERDVCGKWRKITKMTRPESEVYKRALERHKAACAQ